MICDDDQDMLRLFELALEPIYEVVKASSGKECLDKYAKEKKKGNKIDVLLLDYRLGDMTGDDVACKIRELNGTNTILMSAYELEKEVIPQLETMDCVVNIVSKPISIHLLKKMIESAIR
jgi:CheY-like chemotaxis protein